MNREEWIVFWMLLVTTIGGIAFAGILFPYLGWVSWLVAVPVVTILYLLGFVVVFRLFFPQTPSGPD